ncbi:hypothetical protein COBT_001881 [Conglomerata obtusa]
MDDCIMIDIICTENNPLIYPDNLKIAIDQLYTMRKLKLVYTCKSNFILQKENDNYVIKICFGLKKRFRPSGDDLIMKHFHENICKIHYIRNIERFYQPNRHLYMKCIVMESLLFPLTLDYLYEIYNTYNINIYKYSYLQQMAANRLQNILYCLIKAIMYLQLNNMVHGDIKPANIMIGVQNGIYTYKLIDFEGAHTIDSSDFKNFKYTKGYEPPEYREYGKMHAKSDIWCLGMVAYTLITRYSFPPGTEPFASQNYAHFIGRINHYVNQLKLDQNLTNFILSCLMIDPNKRPYASDLINHQYFREKTFYITSTYNYEHYINHLRQNYYTPQIRTLNDNFQNNQGKPYFY